MTVSSTTKKVTASGNGSATVFSFSPFTVFLKTDLLVVKIDAAGSETTVALPLPDAVLRLYKEPALQTIR